MVLECATAEAIQVMPLSLYIGKGNLRSEQSTSSSLYSITISYNSPIFYPHTDLRRCSPSWSPTSSLVLLSSPEPLQTTTNAIMTTATELSFNERPTSQPSAPPTPNTSIQPPLHSQTTPRRATTSPAEFLRPAPAS